MRSIDFGKRAKTFLARVASSSSKAKSYKVNKVKGVHDIHFMFKGEGVTLSILTSGNVNKKIGNYSNWEIVC